MSEQPRIGEVWCDGHGEGRVVVLSVCMEWVTYRVLATKEPGCSRVEAFMRRYERWAVKVDGGE